MNIAVFASGNGSTLQAVIDANLNKSLSAMVRVVISNNANAYALKRAEVAEIDTYVIKAKDLKERTTELIEFLKKYEVDLIVLAGYLQYIGPELIASYPNKIINTHPSLLPKYGGKGMHGMKVHEAVIAAEEEESGVTLHYVNENYDEGAIIKQTVVKVMPWWQAEDLAAAVQKAEKIQLILELQRMAIEHHKNQNTGHNKNI